MSYMAGDGDFAAALDTVRSHLQIGGALLFDFWYGPAVVADPPQRREREVTENGRRIRRITTPYWDKARDAVRIVFDVAEDERPATSEEHVMRYFFEDTLRRDLAAAGFDWLELGEWLTGTAPDDKAFGVYVLAKAV
jgi:hypothetical protein